ncbi:MAG TPA: hypothetical protein VF306_21200 [Pirellulales bacterium]
MHRHPPSANSDRRERFAGYAVLSVAVAVAVVSARDYAGGWNDGSRLATVECLIDFHTLAIDKSVFVSVPRIHPDRDEPFPYLLEYPDTWLFGTKDKILVGGQYYSHKSPLPAVLLAGWYAVWQTLTGYTAREQCDQFCYWMTLGSSGVAYVVAIVCVFHLGGMLRLRLVERLAATASLALATVAAAYTRGVNDHILLLGVAAALLVAMTRLAQQTTDDGNQTRMPWKTLTAIGVLAGLGYSIDSGSGPLLLLATLGATGYRLLVSSVGVRSAKAGNVAFRSAKGVAVSPHPAESPPTAERKMALTAVLIALAIVVLAAAPAIAAHHALTYRVGGTLKPLGSVPEYFDWPGTPFRRENLTGFWNHRSAIGFAAYAAALLFDPLTRLAIGYPAVNLPVRGFLPHNLPLLLLVPGAVTLLRRRPNEWPELLAVSGWACGTWLLYAALSVNFSGDCCSIRWFVPLLAAGYFALMTLMRDDVRYRVGFWLLTATGLPLGAMMWWQGPWLEPDTPYFLYAMLAGLAVWVGWWCWMLLRGRR